MMTNFTVSIFLSLIGWKLIKHDPLTMELDGLIERDLEGVDEPQPAMADAFMAMQTRAVKYRP